MARLNPSYHKRDLYSDVTSRILSELETGAAPWVKPWSATPGQNHPHNAMSKRPYSGCNVVLLWMAQQRHHRLLSAIGDRKYLLVLSLARF